MKFHLALLLSILSSVFANSMKDQNIRNTTEIYLKDLKEALQNSSLQLAKDEYKKSDKKVTEKEYVDALQRHNDAIYSTFEPQARKLIHEAGYNAKGHFFELNRTTGKWTLPNNPAQTAEDGALMNANILEKMLERQFNAVVSGIEQSNRGLRRRAWVPIKAFGKNVAKNGDNIAGSADNIAGSADNFARSADNFKGSADNFKGSADNFARSAGSPPKPPPKPKGPPPQAPTDDFVEGFGKQGADAATAAVTTSFARRALKSLARHALVVLGVLGVTVVLRYMFSSDAEGIDTATQSETSTGVEDPSMNTGGFGSQDSSMNTGGVGSQDPATDMFSELDNVQNQDTVPDSSYPDIYDQENNFYWSFDPEARAYYRFDDNYDIVYYQGK